MGRIVTQLDSASTVLTDSDLEVLPQKWEYGDITPPRLVLTLLGIPQSKTEKFLPKEVEIEKYDTVNIEKNKANLRLLNALGAVNRLNGHYAVNFDNHEVEQIFRYKDDHEDLARTYFGKLLLEHRAFKVVYESLKEIDNSTWKFEFYKENIIRPLLPSKNDEQIDHYANFIARLFDEVRLINYNYMKKNMALREDKTEDIGEWIGQSLAGLAEGLVEQDSYSIVDKSNDRVITHISRDDLIDLMKEKPLYEKIDSLPQDKKEEVENFVNELVISTY